MNNIIEWHEVWRVIVEDGKVVYSARGMISNNGDFRPTPLALDLAELCTKCGGQKISGDCPECDLGWSPSR